MSSQYRPIPASDDSYPPRHHDDIIPFPPKRKRQRFTTILKYFVGSCAAITLLHFTLLGAFPASLYARRFHQQFRTHDAAYASAEAAAADMLTKLDPTLGQPGTFFRDSFAIRSMSAFWELAEKEIAARNLDTCSGQISRPLIEAYHRSQLPFCLPDGSESEVHLAPIRNSSHAPAPHWEPEDGVPSTGIWCMPVHRDDFSDWWPYPAAPCLSTNIRPVPGDQRKFRAVGCSVTDDGVALKAEMGRERFLGVELDNEDAPECTDLIQRTVIVIGRQDQWNPFHVAEDLITTLVSVFIIARSAPELINTRVQLVFSEGYGMDANHFTPLWDRIGAWAPRRLSLDPWREGECLSNTIHSVGAGASLLSAMGVGNIYSCASTITWAASHYYRHLFGLLPRTISESRQARRPINVLWLSRAKLDDYAQKHDDWSTWRDVRHINNEPQLIKRLRSGLAELCDQEVECVFEDAQDVPESWALTSAETLQGERFPLRFATIDPTVHALETQLHYVGHSTILVSSHGGALGLSLFLPPGDATIMELQVDNVKGNFHFQHMAAEMGQSYELVSIERDVNVDQVWGALRRSVLKTVRP